MVLLRATPGFAAALVRILVTFEAAGLTSVALGASPSKVLTGQILNSGHFLQPTAMAMGQIFIGVSFEGVRERTLGFHKAFTKLSVSPSQLLPIWFIGEEEL